MYHHCIQPFIVYLLVIIITHINILISFLCVTCFKDIEWSSPTLFIVLLKCKVNHQFMRGIFSWVFLLLIVQEFASWKNLSKFAFSNTKHQNEVKQPRKFLITNIKYFTMNIERPSFLEIFLTSCVLAKVLIWYKHLWWIRNKNCYIQLLK